MKFRIKKIEYFKNHDIKYKVKYVKTDYGYEWVQIYRRICFIYRSTNIYGDPSEVMGFLNKAIKTINEVIFENEI